MGKAEGKGRQFLQAITDVVEFALGGPAGPKSTHRA